MVRRRGGGVLSDFPYHPDTGCDVSPSCLSCPLPECKFISGLRADSEEKRHLYANVYNGRLTGVTLNSLAARFKVAPRTVSRIIARKGVYGKGSVEPQAVEVSVLEPLASTEATRTSQPVAVKQLKPMPVIGATHSVKFDRPSFVTYFKACPRNNCKGDVQLVPGELSCLQCGWVVYGSSQARLEKTA